MFSQGWWGLDLPILHLHFTFPMYSWCTTRNHVPDSTYNLVDLKSVMTESRNVSPCMTAAPWSRVNWKMCDENSHLLASTPFVHNSVSHDHIVILFMTILAVLTDRACRHDSDFYSEMAVTARAGGECTQLKTKHQSKHQRVLPAYMALHKIAV